MVKLKAQFKRKSSANNVEIFVPVPDDADTPKFRVSFDFQAQRDVDVLMVLATGRFGVGAIRTRQVRVRVEAQAARRWARIPHACTLWFAISKRRYVILKQFHPLAVTHGYTEQESMDKRAPITVKFEIPYFTVSGIQVRYLKIVEKSGYQALPWVRYITQNGDDYRCAIRWSAHTMSYLLEFLVCGRHTRREAHPLRQCNTLPARCQISCNLYAGVIVPLFHWFPLIVLAPWF